MSVFLDRTGALRTSGIRWVGVHPTFVDGHTAPCGAALWDMLGPRPKPARHPLADPWWEAGLDVYVLHLFRRQKVRHQVFRLGQRAPRSRAKEHYSGLYGLMWARRYRPGVPATKEGGA